MFDSHFLQNNFIDLNLNKCRIYLHRNLHSLQKKEILKFVVILDSFLEWLILERKGPCFKAE